MNKFLDVSGQWLDYIVITIGTSDSHDGTHFFGYRALEHNHELLRVTWERVEELLE